MIIAILMKQYKKTGPIGWTNGLIVKLLKVKVWLVEVFMRIYI